VTVCWWFGFQELYTTFTNFDTQWHWYVLAVIYTTSLNEVFGHHLISHQQHKINFKSKIYKILTFLFNVDHGFGPSTAFAIWHPNHHIHVDQKDKDNLDFNRQWFGACSLSPLMYLYQNITKYSPSTDTYYKKQADKHKELLDDDWTFFCEQYRIPLTLVYWGILYLLVPVVLFKIVFMGRAIISMFTFLTTAFCHRKWLGYQHNKTAGSSVNNLFLHYIVGLGFYSGFLHNNHHSRFWIESKTHGFTWYELDLGSSLMGRLFRLLGLKGK
jgi:hypothetical protein